MAAPAQGLHNLHQRQLPKPVPGGEGAEAGAGAGTGASRRGMLA